jgi:hypothetical protein
MLGRRDDRCGGDLVVGMDWKRLDEMEAAEYILRACLKAEASEISLARDHRGAGIFFSDGDSLETFDHLPPETTGPLCRYFKRIAAIDPYLGPPQEGIATLELDDGHYTVVVRTAKGLVGEDLTVSVSTL